MATFEPPKVDYPLSADDILFSRYSMKLGQSLVLENGHYVITPYPWLGEIHGLQEGVEWFQGGRVYEVSNAIGSALVADGFDVTFENAGYGIGPYGNGFYGGSA